MKYNKSIRKILEIINILTGLGLLIIGGVYFFLSQIDFAASWLVFGCMYIVMDKYWENPSVSKNRYLVDIFKFGIGVFGIIVTYAFLWLLLTGGV